MSKVVYYVLAWLVTIVMLRMSEYREINESRNTRYDGFSRTFIRIVKSDVSW